MLRQSGINQAFRESIRRNSKGFQSLYKRDFVFSLVALGIHISFPEAYRWIESRQICFAAKTPDYSESYEHYRRELASYHHLKRIHFN
ncbi:hypothetical protein SB6411_00204 [Klebsiella spallanzanii]|uniref:Uncharacterized protein n=1 Tax=Klebsiella spallanzanii TaxID=2587528 RepID=A0ABY6V4S9_9ENTR|nr:hypothetical protein [Klebsiella spallanzanii]VUS22672.1 hypothetical protein SB6411_00204 [Klebsiella spallanzanii]